MTKAKSKIKVAAIDAIIGEDLAGNAVSMAGAEIATANEAVDITSAELMGECWGNMDEDLSVDDEINKLEGLLLDEAGDRAAMAMSKLADFTLEPRVLDLLEFCIDNVIDSKPERIEDKGRRAKAEMHVAILEMADRDLSAAIDLIVQSAAKGDEPGAVYGLCYALQKSSTYRSNLLYREALDPKADQDADEEHNIAPHDHALHADAPVGCGADVDELDELTVGKFNVEGGFRKLSRYEQVLVDYQDLYYYLQLLTEAFGWDPDAPMPYSYEVSGDGATAKFRAIYDAEMALDHQQVQANARKALRADKQAEASALLIQRARLMLLHAARRKAA